MKRDAWCTSELCKTGCSRQLQGAVVLLLEEICANEMQWLPIATCRTLDNNLDHSQRDSQTFRLHWHTKLGYHTLNLSSLIITTTLQTPNFVNVVCYALCSSGMWCSVGWQLFSSLEQPVGLALKDQVGQEERGY